MTEQTSDVAAAAQRRYEAAQSPEYKAALAAQIDYDSTPEGQKVLTGKIEASNDPGELRGLIARKVAGEHARAFGREFWVFVPPMVKRGEPGYREYRALVNARDELIRTLACAAAETNVWTKPSPSTAQQIFEKLEEVVEREKAAGHKPSSWRHPHLLAASSDRAPWLGTRTDRPVHVGDVAILTVLGMDASWQAGTLVATGNPDAMHRWGYSASLAADQKTWVVATAPDLLAWQKKVDGR